MDRITFSWCIFLSIFTCVIIRIAAVDTDDPNCPILFCVCEPKSTARCINHGKDLDYIPKLPSSVKKLTFVGNFLPELDRSTFSNISENAIKHLNISSNSIQYITRDAFTDLGLLCSLDLSLNSDIHLNELQNSFQYMQFWQDGELHLRKVFKNNEIPMNFFGNFTKSKLGRIFLQQNNLIRINGNTFNQLPHLIALDVSSNDIITIDLNGLHNLVYLVLDNNNFGQVPNCCFKNGSSIIRHLRLLSLKNNKISHLRSGDFSCALSIEFLHLIDNPLKEIDGNVFAKLHYIKQLHLKTSIHSLKEIHKFAFNSSSLRYLNLAVVHFQFKKGTFYPNNIFRSCSQLYTLILSYNRVPSDSTTAIKMFGGLRDLKTLVLQHVNWIVIPGNLFHRLWSLRILDLSQNNIHSLSLNNPFEKMKGLSYLGLATNKLNTLSEHFLPNSILSNLKTMNLAQNPYICDCDLIWFVNWLNKTNITMIGGYPSAYYCVMPPEWKSKPLRSFSKECNYDEYKLLKLILIPSCSSFIFICVIIITLYKMRWHIRYWIYLIRTKGREYTRLHDTECMYEGFVVYCDSDRKWVHDNLVPHLEDEYGYKLCIHCRDFQVGKLIVDNIVESLEQSRKIILVLSNAFAKSEWCQFEVLLAHKRFMANGNGDLVVLLLEEVNSSHFTNALKIILTSTTYAVWSEDENGQLLFWSQILSAFESTHRPDYDYMNVNTNA